jgi:hypothetical protein
VQELVFIYTLTDPRNNEVRYVGKTFDPKQRYYDHTCEPTTRKMNKRRSWIKSLQNLELKPTLEIIETLENATEQEWSWAEQFWIETLRFYGCRLTNMESGGKGGKRLSEETKQKISESRKNFQHSAVTRAKISRASKANMTPEARENLRIKCTGFRHSEETKRIISETNKGLKRSPEHAAKFLAGSLKWKLDRGYVPPEKCHVCNIAIKFKTESYKASTLIEVVGHVHNKCRKLLCVQTN